ncbi:hypothetical protein ACF0MN_11000 [Legionella pneumophila]|uniref:hypothetical protein n=1 Tax=Legionella pneumophila TaxID=446 RepID=UPI0036F482FF
MTPKFEGEIKGFSINRHQDKVDINRCEHESDGILHRASQHGAVAHYRCKKCGEFYRCAKNYKE